MLFVYVGGVIIGMCLGRLNEIDSFGCNCTLECSSIQWFTDLYGSSWVYSLSAFSLLALYSCPCVHMDVLHVLCAHYIYKYYTLRPEMFAVRKPLVVSSTKKENTKTHKQSKSFNTTC